MTSSDPPYINMGDRNAAFAEALDQLLPQTSDRSRWTWIGRDYADHRWYIISRARYGAFCKGGRHNVPVGILRGAFGVTLEEYRAVHILIYQDNSIWAKDVTEVGNDD